MCARTVHAFLITLYIYIFFFFWFSFIQLVTQIYWQWVSSFFSYSWNAIQIGTASRRVTLKQIISRIESLCKVIKHLHQILFHSSSYIVLLGLYYSLLKFFFLFLIFFFFSNENEISYVYIFYGRELWPESFALYFILGNNFCFLLSFWHFFDGLTPQYDSIAQTMRMQRITNCPKRKFPLYNVNLVMGYILYCLLPLICCCCYC